VAAKTLGQVAYEAYRNKSGGKSVISGSPLPEWNSQSDAVKECWQAAGEAANSHEVEARDEYDDEPELWETARDECDEVIELCDELPERAEEFADSVREKLESIKEWIEANEAVTGNQLSAIENMHDGVSRWLN